MKKRKNTQGYFKAAALFMLLTILTCAACSTVPGARIDGLGSLIGNVADVENNESNQTPEDTSGEQKEETEILSETLKQKLELFDYLIDEYYIEDISNEDLQTGIYRGMLEALGDPYSCYYTAEEYAEIMESSSGTYCGIGAYVSQNLETKLITITKPFAGGPADQAGMLKGDIVYKVDGEDVTGMDLNSVVAKMKGEQGTKVVVEVIRDGVDEPVALSIIRDTVEVQTVEYRMLEDKIGYILLTEFNELTAEQYVSAITAMKKQGLEGLIVDLRDNPGGLLDSVVDILDYMLPEGLLVYTKDKQGNVEKEFSDDKDYFDLPVVVLVNGSSASAAEIYTACMQDYKAATIVGTTTFGKGIVQSVIPLTDGTAVKITTSQYFTPRDVCIHGTGVTPDLVVELDEGLEKLVTIPPEDDNQLQFAISLMKEMCQ